MSMLSTSQPPRGHRGRRVLLLVPIVPLVAAFVAPAGAGADASAAAPVGYGFSEVAAIGNPAPGGGNFTFDFEPTAINNSGEVAFTADVDAQGDEAVFVARHGQISQVTRAGLPGPDGVTMGPGELGRLGLNNGGDVTVPFLLQPFDPTLPFGINGGVIRFSHATGALSGVEIPGSPAPGGGTLQGTYYNVGMNNRGDIVYAGLATGTAIEPAGTPPNYNGMALGLFLQNRAGNAVRLVMPGDSAPGGRVFDDAWNGSINSGGDVAFSGHLMGDSCANIGVPFACGDSVYLRTGTTGAITSIAHQGDPAPGGGTFTVTFGALINDSDQVAFVGNLGSPNPQTASPCGIYRYQDGVLSAVAKPGQPMPGGGNFVSSTCGDEELGLNNTGEICFGAQLDSVTNGVPDTGVYCSLNGAVHLVARSGTVLPGVGTIAYLGDVAPVSGSTPDFRYGAATNARGQVLVNATLTTGAAVLMVATPRGGAD